MDSMKIMIVEDDQGIREMTQNYLERKGYRTISAENGEKALHVLASEKPDLVLLDIEMPGLNGFKICQHIRNEVSIPIIFLSVRRGTWDKVKCFEMGGDDYMTKPFDFEELEARIKAHTRRYYTYQQSQPYVLKYGDLEIDMNSYTCYLHGERIELLTKEMELLIYLAKHPNRVWSQEQLYDQVWDLNATGNSDTVKVHISYLRRKLERDHTNPQYIKTVRGFGYLFSG